MIHGKLDLVFVDIGEQILKNIEYPIRVYMVDREGSPQTGRPGGTLPRRSANGLSLQLHLP